jgi:oligopeptide/dipeptide ABC transporter ATP-binding protein
MSALLRVEGLEVVYHAGGRLPALRGIDLEMAPGEVVGVVGESGCGKSTLAQSLLGLLPANAEVVAGQVELAGHDLLRLDEGERRHLRGTLVSAVFQDPAASLNPVFTVRTQMRDVQRAHQRLPRHLLQQRAVELLAQVGIADPEQVLGSYPHQLSGGMCQRVMIALAIASSPRLLIADEPTSALDVTIAAQIIEVLRRQRAERGMAILLISHDLGLVAQLCERVLIMYAGQIVEEAGVEDLFAHPRHPYTRALLASIPSLRRRTSLRSIPGRVPSLSALPPGCSFADRCPHAAPVCRRPVGMVEVAGARVRCHLYAPEAEHPERHV